MIQKPTGQPFIMIGIRNDTIPPIIKYKSNINQKILFMTSRWTIVRESMHFDTTLAYRNNMK